MRILSYFFYFLAILSTQVLYANYRNVTTDTITPVVNSVGDEKTLKLLSTDPIFTENWINDVTFTYDNVKSTDLPEVTVIPLLTPGDKFTPTWYGKLSSGYKWRWGRQHHGVDLGLRTGDPIYAAWEGVVRYAQWNKSGYGNCVVVRHKNGLETLYAHLSKISVSPNQYINSGDLIGLGGSTGRSTGPHLHFEIRYKDFSINPELIIDYSTRQMKLDTFHFVRANISGVRYSGDINAKNTSPISSELDSEPGQQNLASSTNNESQSATNKLSDSARSEVINTVQESKEVNKIGEKPNKKTAESVTKKVTGKKNKTSTKKLPTTYTIKKGDTYTSISKKIGVSIATLKKLNPRQKETALMPGKSIRIR
jgi:murein DD-endopeptidase MepM/ murein hydrolase activator NlpD